MPIDYSTYPDNWKTEIRPTILERAEHRCENCGVENHLIIQRRKGNPAAYKILAVGDEEVLRVLQRNYDRWDQKVEEQYQRPIRVILTVAHLDHDITNNDPDNLAALCQRCHLRHDAKQHARNARECPGQIDLFRNLAEEFSMTVEEATEALREASRGSE